MISKNFINYSVTLLRKDRADHAFSFAIFAFIVFILSSVLFISGSIQNDLEKVIKLRPDIVVEALRAGKRDLMHDGYIYDVSKIAGVSEVQGAVDGMYYFAQKRVWFHIVGDENLNENEMVVGEGVKAAMGEWYYEDEFHFLTEQRLIAIKINKISPHESSIVSNDVIYLNPATAREVLSLKEGEYTKLYVSVPNPNEVSEVALKIVNLYPNTEALSAEDAVAEVRHLYYYKGGIFMVLYTVAMISFFILLKNQISLAYGEKKKEIDLAQHRLLYKGHHRDEIYSKFHRLAKCVSARRRGRVCLCFYPGCAAFARYIFRRRAAKFHHLHACDKFQYTLFDLRL